MADPDSFTAQIRYWKPERNGGLAVVDVPDEVMRALGGLKQQRVTGTVEGNAYTSSTMPAGGGRLALSVSKSMMSAAGVTVGDSATFTVSRETER